MRNIKFMPHKLSVHKIIPKGKVNRNLLVDDLVAKSLARGEVKASKDGVLVVYTGKYTGRSPNDKFIVDTASIHNEINWGKVNMPISEKNFEKLYRKVGRHLSSVDELFIFDGFAGADEEYKLHVRVVSEYAYQSLFINHLLRRPTKEELEKHTPHLTILSAPNCLANPKTDGTHSETFVVLNLEKMLVLIGGTKYSGEIKKSIFSTLNYLLPKKKVMPMHCSANVNKNNEVALFFGLSGTGKTTLSADPDRKLIGDDEHGWSENGIFNFEGGCYAKCINLQKKSEPQIWKAVHQKGVLLENVAMNEKGKFDFKDSSITENTRAAYPMEHIPGAVLEGVSGHPQYIIFLTADAFGVLPPVARLNTRSAMYHFLSGYTSKLAGTERGITEPKATFSECFGSPFMPRRPIEYADLLKHYISTYKSKVYLVNTGWCGGSYGVGKRISIKDTRTIVHAILKGQLDKTKTVRDRIFNLDVPVAVPEIDSKILKPQNLWQDKKDYKQKADGLAKMFVDNFKKFKKVPAAVIKAGPKL